MLRIWQLSQLVTQVKYNDNSMCLVTTIEVVMLMKTNISFIQVKICGGLTPHKA